MRISGNQDFAGAFFEPFAPVRQYQLSAEPEVKTVYVQFRDKAGNISQSFSDSIAFRTEPDTLPDTCDNDFEFLQSVVDAAPVVVIATTAAVNLFALPRVILYLLFILRRKKQQRLGIVYSAATS